MSSASIDFRDCSRSVRRLSAFLTAPSVSTVIGCKRRQLRWLDFDRPEVRHVGIEDQRAQRIFGVADLAFRDNDGLLTSRDLGFGLDDVDRWGGADLNARACVAQRLVGEIQRLPLHAERGDRVREVPERVAHGPRRHRDGLAQTHVGDLAVLAC